jgi:hypothetical protein
MQGRDRVTYKPHEEARRVQLRLRFFTKLHWFLLARAA